MSDNTNEPLRGCPLSGGWRHNNRIICNGTLRIARADFDTNPSEEFQKSLLDWMVERLNTRTPEQGEKKGFKELLDTARKSDGYRAEGIELERDELKAKLSAAEALIEKCNEFLIAIWDGNRFTAKQSTRDAFTAISEWRKQK